MAVPIKVDDQNYYFENKTDAIDYFYNMINRKYPDQERLPKNFIGNMMDGFIELDKRNKKKEEDKKEIINNIVEDPEKTKKLIEFLKTQ